MNINELIQDVPIYQELYDKLLLQKLTLKDLKKLPELTKQHISKGFPNNWITSDLKNVIEEDNYEFMNTSGTTEERILLIRPKNWWFEIEKRMYEYLKVLCPEYTSMQSKAILTTAICSNTLCYKDMPLYEKRIINGILHLNITPDPNNWTKKDIERIIEEIDKFKPQCFQADPIYLSMFFKLIHKYKLKKPTWKPKCLVVAYEYCTKKCMRYIQKHWNIPIYTVFGTTELGVLFYQENDKNIQWMSDDNYLYYKPLENRSDIQEILVTSFRNPYMPMVNYNINDLIQINSKGELIQFMGRSKDITYTRSGKIVAVGEIDNAISKLENDLLIYKLDFYESKIIFRYLSIRDRDLNMKHKQEIIDQLNRLYENKYDIEFIHEKEIKPAPSGKFEIVAKVI